jgi:hypothetical protein
MFSCGNNESHLDLQQRIKRAFQKRREQLAHFLLRPLARRGQQLALHLHKHRAVHVQAIARQQGKQSLRVLGHNLLDPLV